MDGPTLAIRADQLKKAGAYADAAEAFVQYGEILAAAGDHQLASVAFSQAAHCFMYDLPAKAFIAYRASIQSSINANELENAATCAYAAGSAYFLSVPPTMSEREAIDFFLHAANLYEACELYMQAQQAFMFVTILTAKIDCQ